MQDVPSLETRAAEPWPTQPGEQLRALRRERGLSGAQFGALIGLAASKVSEIETGKYQPSVTVAAAIEELSGGRIDAAALNDDVRLARHGSDSRHAAPPSTAGTAGS